VKLRLSAQFRRLSALWVRTAAFVGLAAAAEGVLAQGGPPMVTDDPETPGDGHWEINLAVTGDHTSARWLIAAPDADINYGLGDHIQLKLDVPWNFVQESGQPWKSGLGAAQVGIKWRFVDIEDSGFSMSTYPQYTWNWLSSSVSRGITAPGTEFFLPVEAAVVVGDFGFAAEGGRNFVQDGPNQWVAGVVVAHSCGEKVECVGEVHETWASHNSQTLVNLGFHWQLSESLFLLGAAGREFGPSTPDQSRFHFYLGFQLLR
jgi:hypothetical protein